MNKLKANSSEAQITLFITSENQYLHNYMIAMLTTINS